MVATRSPDLLYQTYHWRPVTCAKSVPPAFFIEKKYTCHRQASWLSSSHISLFTRTYSRDCQGRDLKDMREHECLQLSIIATESATKKFNGCSQLMRTPIHMVLSLSLSLALSLSIFLSFFLSFFLYPPRSAFNVCILNSFRAEMGKQHESDGETVMFMHSRL